MLRPALGYLDSLTGYETTGRIEEASTTRIAAMMDALGNPQEHLPAVHVTGTNGKGSTTSMISALLRGHGLRVGTYTSPHLQHLGERIRVGGRPSTDEQLRSAFEAVEAAARAVRTTPSWFEAVTAAGFVLFGRAGVDAAVVEVGMLGRWDATNIIHGSVAVVTNVDLDHVEFAGPTRAAVAREKAGIIEPGSTLVLGESDPALREIFEAERPARILALGRELSAVRQDSPAMSPLVALRTPCVCLDGVRLAMRGGHQQNNAVLALAAADAFLDGGIDEAASRAAFAATRMPGRFEVVNRAESIILDVAHNPAGGAALRRTLQANFPGERTRILLVGALEGRDPGLFLESIGAAEFDLVVASEPIGGRSVPAAEIVKHADRLGASAVAEARLDRAVEVACRTAGDGGVVLVTGSHQVVGPIRSMLGLSPV